MTWAVNGTGRHAPKNGDLPSTSTRTHISLICPHTHAFNRPTQPTRRTSLHSPLTGDHGQPCQKEEDAKGDCSQWRVHL
jgi:hypothetical protein